MRQLFVQERVSAFTVSDNTLTMKLNQPMADGRDTVRYELDDVQWFKDDLGELVVQQAQKGIITAYDYQASSNSSPIPIKKASVLILTGTQGLTKRLSRLPSLVISGRTGA